MFNFLNNSGSRAAARPRYSASFPSGRGGDSRQDGEFELADRFVPGMNLDAVQSGRERTRVEPEYLLDAAGRQRDGAPDRVRGAFPELPDSEFDRQLDRTLRVVAADEIEGNGFVFAHDPVAEFPERQERDEVAVAEERRREEAAVGKIVGEKRAFGVRRERFLRRGVQHAGRQLGGRHLQARRVER